MLKLFFLLSGLIFVSGWGEILFILGLVSFMVSLMQSESSAIMSGLSYELDSLSWGLIVLSIWVVCLCLMGSCKVLNNKLMEYMFSLAMLSLLFFLVLSFSVSNLIYFYISFECSLIPIFFLILGWGYQPERSQAGFYFIFYTLFGSLPLFYIILSWFWENGSCYMHTLGEGQVISMVSGIFMVGAFLVKFPIYGAHLWLLKAHVEAPVAGSMILAGVLLKLGGYGLIRIFCIWEGILNEMVELVLVISIWGGVVVSLSCMRQIDVKLLIASSSVVHMSLCISGLFIFSWWGFKGAYMVMIAHGLCSSGLFYLANLLYDRTSSRSLLVCKGMLNLMPSISLWWFLFCAANMAAPPSMNLVGEMSLLISLISWNIYTVLSLSIMSFFSAAYSLYLFSLSQHGVYLMSKGGIFSGYMVEYLVCLLHWVPLNYLVLACWFFSYLDSLI
uniref:NADH-ubiquinone oxidoreductase chain 4 n=1 Tax=Epimeria frankei TaxID=2184360 RepID=A0A2S1TMA8_9CRUS|nr:NADH dehydrogenase subunit 4 [Epimeria frankei]